MGKKCSMCGATAPVEFYKCAVCGNVICDECAVECDKCHKMYCGNHDCGDPYIDESEYHFCRNCW